MLECVTSARLLLLIIIISCICIHHSHCFLSTIQGEESCSGLVALTVRAVTAFYGKEGQRHENVIFLISATCLGKVYAGMKSCKVPEVCVKST